MLPPNQTLTFTMSTSTAPATISTAEFAAVLAKGAACVLDVRTPAEFAECHVASAKLAPLDGQVRIAIGALILVFMLLARTVHHSIGYLIPAMAVALIVSGLTGFCGMALLLGKAPWNQNKDTGSCRVC